MTACPPNSLSLQRKMFRVSMMLVFGPCQGTQVFVCGVTSSFFQGIWFSCVYSVLMKDLFKPFSEALDSSLCDLPLDFIMKN